jgi:hypothetical protein
MLLFWKDCEAIYESKNFSKREFISDETFFDNFFAGNEIIQSDFFCVLKFQNSDCK